MSTRSAWSTIARSSTARTANQRNLVSKKLKNKTKKKKKLPDSWVVTMHTLVAPSCLKAEVHGFLYVPVLSGKQSSRRGFKATEKTYLLKKSL